MAHNHSYQPDDNFAKAFLVGIVLNAAFVAVEFVAGFRTDSLALLSDAGHNLSDVASLALSWFAFRISKAKATERFTYGYGKSTILASLANAVILLIAVGGIGWEAIRRFMHPEPTQGGIIAIVAAIGIGINTVSALMFFRGKDTDLNVKGAYLHLAADAAVSAGVVVAGLVISYTHILWIDPLISLVIMAVVVYSTWGLLRDSLRLSLDAVPANVDLEKVVQTISKQPGVKAVNHVHVWAMSTTKNALTAHVIINSDDSVQTRAIKDELRHELEHLNIHHATLETDDRNPSSNVDVKT